ncbi:AAA family ATPase [Candidatus Woesearchaeota archaeon]|nr:AAA family ATPase [Candidatus Woesearchaeota archaeon]
MGLFDNMLKEGESLFKNEVALDFSFQPKLLPYREKEQRQIAADIKPLFQKLNGRNALIYGKPGIGKTVAIKHVFKELEEQSEEVLSIYINCWQKNTSYKIVLDICDQIGYKFTQNKKTEELWKIVQERLNKTSVALALDEVDKLEEYDFIYIFLEDIYRKSIFLISNYKEWFINLDNRIKSRLNAEILEFNPYNYEETKGILEQRRDFAFVSNIWDDDAFRLVVEASFAVKDIRTGLHLMRESGLLAEDASAKKITLEEVKKALQKLDQLGVKDDLKLDDETDFILDIIKLNSGKKIGDLYKLYQDNKGESSYKTFKRKIDKLEEGKFISTKKIPGGVDGSTTMVTYESVVRLSDFT